MSRWRFLVFTFLGAAIWNVLLILGGQLLEGYLERSQDAMGWIILGAIALALLAYLWRVLTWKPRERQD